MANENMPKTLYVVAYEADNFTHCGHGELSEAIPSVDTPVEIGIYRLVKVSHYVTETKYRTRAITPEQAARIVEENEL